MSSNNIVIIGGVACGPKAAARAKRLDPQANITIIEQGSALSYAGCGMPYYISGRVPELRELMSTPIGVPRSVPYFRDVKGIQVFSRRQVISVQRDVKTVQSVDLDTGEKHEQPYDKLVLATGGYSVMPPIPGIRLDRVFGLREPRHASAIRDAVLSGSVTKVVIIGGGFIGLEMSEALAAHDVHVTLVERQPRILPNLLDEDSAAFLCKHLQDKGVEVHVDESVERIHGDMGAVTSVTTTRREIEADMVLVSLGVRPRSDLAREMGLALGKHGGILVNEHLQTSDPDIYAGGDCVLNKNLLTGDWSYAPLGSVANKHGRVIGTNLVGGNETFPGVVGTGVVKVFDYNLGCTGLSERTAKEKGYSVVTTLCPGPDRAHYYPGAATLLVKLIADAASRRVLGAQILGPGDADKRVDVMATALRFGATVDDLANLDLGYTPPFSEAMDNLHHAANILRNKIDGVAKGLSPLEVKAKLAAGEEFVLLDVRSPAEVEALRIDAPNITYVPLGKLRSELDHLPRDKPIVTLCKVSLRGYEALRILQGAGFANVSFMDGGVVAWPFEFAD
ncbi:MAG: FAD-dependent oxidoreductase [Chromatiales bacterium]